MSCAQIRERVYPFLDRALEPGEVRRVEDHLGACPECREWFDRTGAIDRRVRAAVRRPALPPGLAERIHRGLDAAEAPSRPRTFWLAMAAGVLVALSLGLAWYVAQVATPPGPQIAFSTFGRAVESYHREQASVSDESLEIRAEAPRELEDRLSRAVGFHACVPDPTAVGARVRGGATGILVECPTEPRVGYVRYEKDGLRITHLDLVDPGLELAGAAPGEPAVLVAGEFVVVVARYERMICLFASHGIPRDDATRIAHLLLP